MAGRPTKVEPEAEPSPQRKAGRPRKDDERNPVPVTDTSEKSDNGKTKFVKNSLLTPEWIAKKKRQFVTALVQNNACRGIAAKECGIPHTLVREWQSEDPEFVNSVAQAEIDGLANTFDDALMLAWQNAEEGNYQALRLIFGATLPFKMEPLRQFMADRLDTRNAAAGAGTETNDNTDTRPTFFIRREDLGFFNSDILSLKHVGIEGGAPNQERKQTQNGDAETAAMAVAMAEEGNDSPEPNAGTNGEGGKGEEERTETETDSEGETWIASWGSPGE